MQKGISIVGAVFTLLILAVFGASVVTLVSSDHESRRRMIEKEQAFYSAQAGLEYAVHEINYGGYPVQTNKAIGEGRFTVLIDYPSHNVSVTGISGDTNKVHQITKNPMGADCLVVNTVGASLGGVKTDLQGITLQKICLNAITIASIVVSWSNPAGEKVTKVTIDNNILYNNVTGTASGIPIDIADFSMSDSATHTINLIQFSSGMSNKPITITFNLSDTSYKTVSVALH